MPLLTARELAAALNTSERHVNELRYHRRIPTVKVGRLNRYDLDEVLAALRESSPAA